MLFIQFKRAAEYSNSWRAAGQMRGCVLDNRCVSVLYIVYGMQVVCTLECFV